jgi:bifunctional DNase/RNase
VNIRSDILGEKIKIEFIKRIAPSMEIGINNLEEELDPIIIELFNKTNQIFADLKAQVILVSIDKHGENNYYSYYTLKFNRKDYLK